VNFAKKTVIDQEWQNSLNYSVGMGRVGFWGFSNCL